jgi:hypothetical protein
VPDNKGSKRGERQERLAAELRANLKKRKVQARSRREQAENGGDIAPAAPDLRPATPSAKS